MFTTFCRNRGKLGENRIYEVFYTNIQKSLPDSSAKAISIKTGGQYDHYKGLLYIILAIARHSETLEELVVYQE